MLRNTGIKIRNRRRKVDLKAALVLANRITVDGDSVLDRGR